MMGTWSTRRPGRTCEGFPTDVGSVRICTSIVWLYNTKIPNDSDGLSLKVSGDAVAQRGVVFVCLCRGTETRRLRWNGGYSK